MICAAKGIFSRFLKCIRGGGDHQDLRLFVCQVAPAVPDVVRIVQRVMFIQFISAFIFQIKNYASVQHIYKFFSAVVGILTGISMGGDGDCSGVHFIFSMDDQGFGQGFSVACIADKGLLIRMAYKLNLLVILLQKQGEDGKVDRGSTSSVPDGVL